MKFKGLVFALAVCLTILGCGGSGGSSSNLYLRTVVLVHPAPSNGTFGSSDFTVSGSSTGNVVTSVNAPVITGFSLTTDTAQSFTATDVIASPNITLGTTSLNSPVQNAFYSLYVTGIEGSSTFPPALAIVQENPPAAVATNAWVRYANFSTSIPSPGAVDVYLTATATSALTTPTFTGVAYGAVSNYVSLAGGGYFIRVTPTGQPGNVLYTSSVAYTFTNGFYYSNFGWDSTTTAPTVLTQQDIY